MSDFVTVVEAEDGRRLAKLYSGDVYAKPEDYDGGFWYRAERIPLEGLSDLAELLAALASDPGACIVRGDIADGAPEWTARRSNVAKYADEADPRARAWYRPAEHHWLCIDFDVSIIAFDPADPWAAVRAWRASLPEGLREAGMVFQLSAQSHRFPYLRGHAWVWSRDKVGDGALRAWLAANDWDPSVANPVQPHYTADPIFDGCDDPLNGERLFVLEGPEAVIDFGAVPVVRTAVARTAPTAAPDSSVLEVLGPAVDHEGHRWHLCGALGGVWRRLGRSAEWARAQIEAWLAPVPGCDVARGVERCLGAWAVPFDRATGAAELTLHLGDQAWAERIAVASTPKVGFRASTGAPDMAPVTSELVGDLSQPFLLGGARNQMWIRTDAGYAGPYAHKRMRLVARKHGAWDLVCVNGDGKLKSYDGIYDGATHVETVVRAFADSATWFDESTDELHQGYTLPMIEPREDVAVAAWLAVLSGPMLANVLDWIRSCAQDAIGIPAAALVVIGPPGVGKTLLFKALARMWGARTFVPLKDSVAQFNSTITRCPLVCDDECAALKARLVTSAEFRQRVQAEERDFEFKGQEKIELVGCTREGITANDLDEVTFTDVRGSGVVDALRDRLLVIEAPLAAKEALAAVRGDGDRKAERDRICGHLAWLWTTRPLAAEPGRFIGAGGAGAERVAMAGVESEGAEVWDHLASFLEGPWPKAEAKPKAAPWLVRDGVLWCYPGALVRHFAVTIGAGRWDLKAIQRLIRPLRVGSYVQVETSEGNARFWPLDWDRACALAGVSPEAMVAKLVAHEKR